MAVQHWVLGGKAIPLHGIRIVLGNAPAVVVHDAEVVLGWGVTLLGGQTIPPYRLGIVLRYARAVVVHDAEVVLGSSIALLDQRQPLPVRRGIVLPLVGIHPGLEVRQQTHRPEQYKCQQQTFHGNRSLHDAVTHAIPCP